MSRTTCKHTQNLISLYSVTTEYLGFRCQARHATSFGHSLQSKVPYSYHLIIYRPPLEFAPSLNREGKYKPLRGLNDGLRDYWAMFEDTPPPEPKALEKAEEKKQRIKKDKLVQHLVQQKEELKKCKYIVFSQYSSMVSASVSLRSSSLGLWPKHMSSST